MGRHNGKATFCVGPLPGESARVSFRRQKRHHNEAVLQEIIEASPARTGDAEEHHPSCSPWQGVDYGYQIRLKTEMLHETYRQHTVSAPLSGFHAAKETLGFRNRLDFTLTDHGGRLQLAFHTRGTWDSLVMLPHGCRLGAPTMNLAAQAFVDKANQYGITSRLSGDMLTVRHSRSTGEVLLVLTTSQDLDWPMLQPDGAGLVVARPRPGSGAPGEAVYATGATSLSENFGGLAISYPYGSFFQTNTEMFTLALQGIAAAVPFGSTVIELYSGVGAIGLPLAHTAAHVQGIEIDSNASLWSLLNAKAAGINNYSAVAMPAEQAATQPLAADVVIVDPPRAGLHPKVVRQLLQSRPQRIIYLSCNPVTQARDTAMLREGYSPTSLTGYDFYPQTLHMEALLVLERR